MWESLGAFDLLSLRQNEFSKTKAGCSECLGSLQEEQPSSASWGRNLWGLFTSCRFLSAY